MVSVAQWSLKASKPLKALRAAEEALGIFKELGYGKGRARARDPAVAVGW